MKSFIILSAVAALLSSCSSDVNVALEKSPAPTYSPPASFPYTEDRDPELANPYAVDPIWWWDPARPDAN